MPNELVVCRIAAKYHAVGIRDRKNSSDQKRRVGLLELAEVLAQPIKVESADKPSAATGLGRAQGEIVRQKTPGMIAPSDQNGRG